MAGQTRDLEGAHFGEPWQARDRSGVPISPPTWRVVAAFPDGERVTVARRGRTDAEAYERIDALRKRPYGAGAGTRWTMQEVWDDWWVTTSGASEASRRTLPDGAMTRSTLIWQDSTRVRYRGIWQKHLTEKWADRDPASITRAEIYEWLHEPRTVQPKMLLDALRVICRHAENRGIMPTDPTHGGFQLSAKKPEPRPLTSDQLDLIEDHLETLKASPRQPDAMRLHDGWVILRASGARISEMLSLQVGDFDAATGTLAIGQRHLAKVTTPDGRSTIALVEGTKTSAGTRRVPVTPDGAALLTKRADGRASNAFIIANADGRRVSTNAFSNALFREMRRIGIEATAHDLRDTISTTIAKEMVVRRGLQAGLLAAARHLGHSSTKSLPAYVDDSQVLDVEMAEVIAATDPRARRLADVQAVALGLTLAGLGAADVRTDGDTLVVVVGADESVLDAWRTATARFGERVRVEHDQTGSYVQF